MNCKLSSLVVIAVEGHPMKDGSRGGQYQSARLPDGRTLKQGANPNPARPAPAR
jgi:hypothetical protein